MNDLVKRLSEGSYPVEVSLRPERTVKLFREMLDRGHVLIKFTQTKGGTELGFPLDKTRSDLTKADLNAETGKVRACGELTLDYVPVRVVADIALPSLEGQGHLEIREGVPSAWENPSCDRSGKLGCSVAFTGPWHVPGTDNPVKAFL